MPVTAYLGLGSNLGDRAASLREALVRLQRSGVRVCRVSGVYESEAILMTDQPPFLNLVARVETDLEARQLLELCLSVEKEMGRVRTVRWGPRIIDIDILLYGDAAVREPGLTLPHPGLRDRAFVTVPLEEVAEQILVPVPSNHREQVRRVSGPPPLELSR